MYMVFFLNFFYLTLMSRRLLSIFSFFTFRKYFVNCFPFSGADPFFHLAGFSIFCRQFIGLGLELCMFPDEEYFIVLVVFMVGGCSFDTRPCVPLPANLFFGFFFSGTVHSLAPLFVFTPRTF